MKDYDLMVEEEEQIAFVLAENVPGTGTAKVSVYHLDNVAFCKLLVYHENLFVSKRNQSYQSIRGNE